MFVSEGLVKPYILAIDITLVKAKRGKMWHKSSMGKGIMPCSGIDTDARWGFSHTKGWVFGYKLHMVSSTGSVAVPLSADVTTANVQDNQVYAELHPVYLNNNKENTLHDCRPRVRRPKHV